MAKSLLMQKNKGRRFGVYPYFIHDKDGGARIGNIASHTWADNI